MCSASRSPSLRTDSRPPIEFVSGEEGLRPKSYFFLKYAFMNTLNYEMAPGSSCGAEGNWRSSAAEAQRLLRLTYAAGWWLDIVASEHEEPTEGLGVSILGEHESGSVHSTLDLQRKFWTRLPWNPCFPLSVFRPCSFCIYRRHFCSPIARGTFHFASSGCVAIRHVSHWRFLNGKSSLLLTIGFFFCRQSSLI